MGHRENVLLRDKRGSTLIELVVSVLIVGIAFVPLMISLNTAMKANRQSEAELYAEAVASNCIEAGKAYGIAKLKAIDTVGGPGGETVSTSISSHYSDSLNNAYPIEAVSTGAKIARFIDGANIQVEGDDSSRKYEEAYLVTNISEGTKEYYAEILFDKSAYDGAGKQNDPDKYKSIAAINNALTVNLAGDADDTYLTSFAQKATDESPSGTSYTKEDAKDWIKRKESVVEIGEVTDTSDENCGKYYVKTKTVYKAYALDGGESRFGSAATETDGADEVYVLGDEYDIVGYYTGYPDSLILYYSTLDDPKDAAINSSSIESIKIIKTTVHELNVYCICKGADINAATDVTNAEHSYYMNDKMFIDVDNVTEKATDDTNVKIFNVLANEKSDTSDAYSALDSMISSSSGEGYGKIYDIIIQVYDVNNTEHKPIITKRSTIVE